jgi:non-ribosomal peptide synthetase component F
LFDVWSEYHGWNDASEDAAAGFALPSAPGTEFDLRWRVTEQADGGFDGRIDYAVDLFDESTVERMAEDYLDLLRTVVADPTRPLVLPEPVAAGGTPNAGAVL